MKNRILNQYNTRFENPQIYVKSPGRVNIIGEHTDYNHGLSLPFAIEQSIDMVLGVNEMNLLRVYASDLDEYSEIDIHNLNFETEGWHRYFNNVLVALSRRAYQGIDVVFGGNLPSGGGVSSSSAITCGFLAGTNLIFDLKLSIDTLIDMASQAENGIGLQGGILDQTAIFKGIKDKAIKIDFLDFSIEEYHLPPKPDFHFYLFNSGQKHDLVTSGYNNRRATCETALDRIKNHNAQVDTFRDVSHSDINTWLTDPIEKLRCIHVIEENERVIQATHLLVTKEYELLGEILNASHESLSKKYEISTPEIDYLVEISQSTPSILGSRIMGGGFGGCTINFTNAELTEKEIATLRFDYKNETGLELSIVKVEAHDGIRCYPIEQ